MYGKDIVYYSIVTGVNMRGDKFTIPKIISMKDIEFKPGNDKNTFYKCIDAVSPNAEISKISTSDNKIVISLSPTNYINMKGEELQKKFTNVKYSDWGKIIITNESSINEGILFGNREKKSNETKDLNVDITDAKEIIRARASEIVYMYNRDQSVKKKIRKDIDSTMKMFPGENFDGFASNRNVPKLGCSVYKETSSSMILLIYDGSQPMRVAMSTTIKNIKKDLMKDKTISSLPGLNSISIGDGDEGCLYISFKK